MKDYMNLTLQLNAFPTHFINKDGSIAKVMSDYKSLEVWKLAVKNNSEVGLFLSRTVFFKPYNNIESTSSSTNL
jgi:hypothetical protein